MRRWLLVATLVAGARPLAPPRIAPPTLGVDYGLRRVGVCVGVGFASRPLEVIEHDEDIDAVVARLLQIARRERIASIVVGLPLEKDGAEGLQCAATRRFADALAAAAPAMPLVLWDERFSSREAEALLAHRPGAALDAVAACVILDDFFASADDGAAAPPAPPAPAPPAPPAAPAAEAAAAVPRVTKLISHGGIITGLRPTARGRRVPPAAPLRGGGARAGRRRSSRARAGSAATSACPRRRR